MKTSYEVLMTETGVNARAPPRVHNPNFNTLFKYIIFFRDLHTELCISAYTGKMFFVTDRNENIFVLGSPYNSFCKVNQFGGLRLCKSSPLSGKGGRHTIPNLRPGLV